MLNMTGADRPLSWSFSPLQVYVVVRNNSLLICLTIPIELELVWIRQRGHGLSLLLKVWASLRKTGRVVAGRAKG